MIRELDLEDLAFQVPPDLLESSHPSLEEDVTASNTATPAPEVDTQVGEREVLKKSNYTLSRKKNYTLSTKKRKMILNI